MCLKLLLSVSLPQYILVEQHHTFATTCLQQPTTPIALLIRTHNQHLNLVITLTTPHSKPPTGLTCNICITGKTHSTLQSWLKHNLSRSYQSEEFTSALELELQEKTYNHDTTYSHDSRLVYYIEKIISLQYHFLLKEMFLYQV